MRVPTMTPAEARELYRRERERRHKRVEPLIEEARVQLAREVELRAPRNKKKADKYGGH